MRETASDRLNFLIARSIRGRKVVREWMKGHFLATEALFSSEAELRQLASRYNQEAKEGSRWEVRIVTEECASDEDIYDSVLRKGVRRFEVVLVQSLSVSIDS